MNAMLAVGSLLAVLGIRRLWAHRKDGDRAMLVEWAILTAIGGYLAVSSL